MNKQLVIIRINFLDRSLLKEIYIGQYRIRQYVIILFNQLFLKNQY